MLADRAVVAWYVRQGSVGEGALTSLGEIDVAVRGYLAAGRNIDPTLLDALLQVRGGEPPLPVETKTD